MVWSQVDFIREVRRQLIELETLRRKIRARSDVEEHLDRLFESNRQLLRKLSEYFEARDGTTALAESRGKAPEYILAYLQSLLQQPSLVEHLAGHTSAEEAGAWLLLAVGSGLEHPILKECCGLCGKLLVSSVLAGSPVIQEGKEWFHKSCHDQKPAPQYWRPTALN